MSRKSYNKSAVQTHRDVLMGGDNRTQGSLLPAVQTCNPLTLIGHTLHIDGEKIRN